jgi:hypothetical protein
VERVRSVTSWPSSDRAATREEPTNPVPPVMKTRISESLGLLLSSLKQAARAFLPPHPISAADGSFEVQLSNKEYRIMKFKNPDCLLRHSLFGVRYAVIRFFDPYGEVRQLSA